MALIDMNFSCTDLAYAAGMVDGDGSVSVHKSPYVQKNGSRSFMVTVRVSQKSDEIPLWFCATFGGKLRRIGNKKDHYKNGKITFKSIPMWAWEVYCQDAADFLEAIIPYLKMKRYRAELAVELARMHKRRGGIGYRYGGRQVTPEENEERGRLALLIRSENLKSNAGIASRCTWGVN